MLYHTICVEKRETHRSRAKVEKQHLGYHDNLIQTQPQTQKERKKTVKSAMGENRRTKSGKRKKKTS